MLKMIIGVLTACAVMFGANAAIAGEDGPSDVEIAHIAYSAGVIDIRYAHLALAVSDNPDIRAFAETMVRDHIAVNDVALALLKKLNASPVDNATSQALNASAGEKRAELSALSGAGFDKAYAANELAYHQFVNKTLEESLIPAADNKDFKELLGVALKTFKVHEGHAENLVEGLN